MTSLSEGPERIVAFVGAGASAVPPSRLPTWTAFNTLLLEALCDRLATYSRNRQPTSRMLEVFRTRRDETQFFAPDFQAQLIEEEIGRDYFRVWQSLDTDVYGPVHAGLAELACRERLAAVVTLNFDRLVETALTARHRRFEVYHTAERFAVLPDALEHAGNPLPVIKIHGSIEDAASLIDTLRQRLAGRPEGLARALASLLRRYPWMFLGFSGADFSYDPHYLGILDAAAEARGFVFVAREGAPVQPGVQTVMEAYGPQKASLVHGDLTTWIQDRFNLPVPDGAAQPGGNPPEERVKARIAEWVAELGPMAVVNIVCSMLRSSGMEADALWLLRKTWKSYRWTDDTQGKSYARYNYNYGLALLDAGFIRNPVSLAGDMSNLPEWKAHADQNAFEFLARSYKDGDLLAAGARVAAVLAYRGEVGKALSLGSHVIDAARERQDPLELCDVAIASVVIYDIVQMFRAPAVQLRQCLDTARRVGDEPRRALLSAHLGRVLTYSGNFAEADAHLRESERIAARLDLHEAAVAARAARGLWYVDSGESPERAIALLNELAGELREKDKEPLVTRADVLQPDAPPDVITGRDPRRCRVLLDLNRAAMLSGDGPLIERTLDELDELATDVFTGYCPHYYLAYAQCLLTRGDGDQLNLVRELLARARRLGEDSGNPWVAAAAAHLEQHMGAA